MTAFHTTDDTGTENVIEFSDSQEARRVASLTDGRNLFDVAREVVESKSFGFCEGMILDLFSSSILVQIHDGLNDENREKLRGMPTERAYHVTMALFDRVSKR